MTRRDTIPTWGDRRFARIGLLGGSFNPAHCGHRTIAQRALVALGLDQVWLMVSPGNPLKPAAGMAPFARRFDSAASLADGHRLIATDIEARLGTRYTFDTLGKLQTRFPNVHFVWLTGADGFVTLPRWKGWKRLLHRVPVAVMPRPGQTMRALRGAAAHYLAHYRLSSGQARLLPDLSPPVWTFLPGRQNGISATSIRQQGGFGVDVGQTGTPDTFNSGDSS